MRRSSLSASLNPEEVYVSVHHAAVKSRMPLDFFVITLLDEAAGEVDAG